MTYATCMHTYTYIHIIKARVATHTFMGPGPWRCVLPQALWLCVCMCMYAYMLRMSCIYSKDFWYFGYLVFWIFGYFVFWGILDIWVFCILGYFVFLGILYFGAYGMLCVVGLGGCCPIPNSRVVCVPPISLSPYIFHAHTRTLNRYSRTLVWVDLCLHWWTLAAHTFFMRKEKIFLF